MTRSCWVKIVQSEVKSCCKQDRPTGSYPARQWNKSHSASGLNYVPSSGQISTIHLDALTPVDFSAQLPRPAVCPQCQQHLSGPSGPHTYTPIHHAARSEH